MGQAHAKLSADAVHRAISAALAARYPALNYLDVRTSQNGEGLDVVVGIKRPDLADADPPHRPWAYTYRSLYGETEAEACDLLLASVIPAAKSAGIVRTDRTEKCANGVVPRVVRMPTG